MSYVYGLGADTVQVGAASTDMILDHKRIPFLAKPSYLRLVKTVQAAKNYAAAGFHVAVSRGLAGGCQDLSTAFNGTGPASCKSPLYRSDLTSKWKTAAVAYASAYGLRNLPDMITAIKQANAASDAAFQAEGITPPKDPVTGNSEPPAVAPGPVGGKGGASFLDQAGLPVLAVAGLGAWYLWGGGKGGKKKGKRKARKGGARRTRRSRRRR